MAPRQEMADADWRAGVLERVRGAWCCRWKVDWLRSERTKKSVVEVEVVVGVRKLKEESRRFCTRHLVRARANHNDAAAHEQGQSRPSHAARERLTAPVTGQATLLESLDDCTFDNAPSHTASVTRRLLPLPPFTCPRRKSPHKARCHPSRNRHFDNNTLAQPLLTNNHQLPKHPQPPKHIEPSEHTHQSAARQPKPWHHRGRRMASLTLTTA